MNNRFFLLGSAVACLVFGNAAIAADHDSANRDRASAPAATDGGDAASKARAAWIAEAKATYPMTTCVVSDDKLEGGDMGGPVEYVYSQEGKPDRLVRFCCKDCVKDFKKDPAKYLAMIDAAAAKKAAQSPGTAN